MPLNDTWWDPAGPFGDNAEGAITAEIMRDFARAIAEDGVTGSWFSIAFSEQAITPVEWSTPDVTKILWLEKTAEFHHSDDWLYQEDPEHRDAYTYQQPGDITVQITFSPSVINVTQATSGTTMTPVACLTLAPVGALWEEPDDTNTFVVGPSLTVESANQIFDVGGWATVLRATTERNVRLGLRFVPEDTKGITTGGSSFAVNATGAGATVVARPLAPRSE